MAQGRDGGVTVHPGSLAGLREAWDTDVRAGAAGSESQLLVSPMTVGQTFGALRCRITVCKRRLAPARGDCDRMKEARAEVRTAGQL